MTVVTDSRYGKWYFRYKRNKKNQNILLGKNLLNKDNFRHLVFGLSNQNIL